jgi:putative transposase
LRNPEIERIKVSVRYDPFDVGVAYAYVQGRWVKCISQYYSIFEGRSEKELLLASQEIKQQGKLTRSSPSVSAKRLAEFIANVQEHETLLLQRLRDLEGKQVQSALTERTARAPELGSGDASSSEITSVTEAVPREEITLSKANQSSPSKVKATGLEIPPVDLSRLPIFGEYR